MMKYKTSEGERRRQIRYRNKNKERLNEKRRIWRLQNKKTTLQYYGNGNIKCVLCGEERLAALSIDHINGGGTKHRQQILVKGANIYVWLRKQGFPSGYRTLCMNCQFVEKERLKYNQSRRLE